MSSLDANDGNPANDAAASATAVQQVGCAGAGLVHASQSWRTVRLELDGVCDRDRGTGKVYLHRAKLTLAIDGQPSIQLRLVDFKQVAISGGTDAIVTAVWDGKPVVVTVREGTGNKNDTVRVQVGAYDSGTLSTKHGDVRVRQD